MVAMRSVKAAIAQSMKMRDLINSNSPDHSLGDKAPVGLEMARGNEAAARERHYVFTNGKGMRLGAPTEADGRNT